MARRSDHTRDEIRAMAIAAGQQLIAAEGLSKFSARKVAREIGYTVSTIFNVFGDYDTIIFRINSVTLEEMKTFILTQPQLDSGIIATLKHLASCYLQFAQTNYNRWTALFEHHTPVGESLPDYYLERIKQLFTLVESQLLTVLNNDKQQAERAAKTMWASVHGICELGLSGKLDKTGVESLQQMLETLVDNFMAGLVPPKHLARHQNNKLAGNK